MQKKNIYIFIAFTLIYFTGCKTTTPQPTQDFNAYKQVNEANPLKGFVPFAGTNNAIPTSMEFFYMPLNAIEKSKGVYDFSEFEKMLNQISERKHQAVLRIYLDYPESKNGTPDYYWDEGIEKLYYTNPDTGNKFYFPDYTNQKCIDNLCAFITEWGKQYDGDPRIAFIFCGLIGHWGEWHNYYYTLTGKSEHMPTSAQQAQLYKAFSTSFKKTYSLTRYPTDSSLEEFTNIGFHDDSFTEDTINDSYDWYFMSRLKQTNMTERWKIAPIGGELRPENQVPFLNEKKYKSYYQDYDTCVKQTHCSWLLYDAAFYSERTPRQREIGWKASKQLGYDLFCSDIKYSVNSLTIDLEIELTNKGVAPFYYNWQPVVEIINNKKLKTFTAPFAEWNLPEIGENQKRSYTASLDISDLKNLDLSKCKIVLTIPNPDTNGLPLKLSNASLNYDKQGYITLVPSIESE